MNQRSNLKVSVEPHLIVPDLDKIISGRDEILAVVRDGDKVNGLTMNIINSGQETARSGVEPHELAGGGGTQQMIDFGTREDQSHGRVALG